MTPEEREWERANYFFGQFKECQAALAERDRIAGADEGYLVGWAIKNGWLNPQDATALRAERDALREALEEIRTYWNGRQNDRAMLDACEHAVRVATTALAAGKGEP